MEVMFIHAPACAIGIEWKTHWQVPVSDNTNLTAKFHVPYQPGQLKASAIEIGKTGGTVLLATRNAPTHIHLIADRTTIKASRNDLSYVSVQVVDDQDRVVPNAELPIQFSVSGNGEIAAVGSANPADMSSFKALTKKTFWKMFSDPETKGRAENIIEGGSRIRCRGSYSGDRRN
jgi:beta-galactosidase